MDFLIGAASGCSAVIFSNPLEVIKTRMQLQGELMRRGTHVVHYKGFFHAAYVIARKDGLKALQRGLISALAYQCVMNSTRLGIYQLFDKNGLLRNRHGEVDIIRSLLVSGISGGIGAFVASPFNQIKTQMQAMSSTNIAVGLQHRHTGTWQALTKLSRSGGIAGLYAGARIAAVRIAVGSAVQLTTFSRAKDTVQTLEVFPEYPILQAFLASCVSGVWVAVVASPLDVMLTRLYNQGVPASKKSLYNGIFDCALKIFKTEGPLGFYKGLMPLYFKTAPHVILLMFFWEKYKLLYNIYVK